MTEILEKKTIQHSNGMTHHSCKYLKDNNLKLIALVERPYNHGKQASLIRADYDFFDRKWVAEEVRFFYDDSLNNYTYTLGFDELYDDAIKNGRLEYIAAMKDVDIDKDYFDNVFGSPVKSIKYRCSLDLKIKMSKPAQGKIHMLNGLDVSGYDIFVNCEHVKNEDLDLIDIKRDNALLCKKGFLIGNYDSLDPDPLPLSCGIMDNEKVLEYKGKRYWIKRQNPQ